MPLLRRTPSSRSRHIHHVGSKVKLDANCISFVQGGVALTLIGWQQSTMYMWGGGRSTLKISSYGG